MTFDLRNATRIVSGGNEMALRDASMQGISRILPLLDSESKLAIRRIWRRHRFGVVA